MADEVEKLINISLCKMAQSRTPRRGGTSLHKHLLISGVLTKARSAYFETLYMGDSEAAYSDGESTRTISLNASFQEVDFPLDDDDDDDDLLDDPTEDQSDSYMSSSHGHALEHSSVHESGSAHCGADSESNNNDNNMIDPRFFVEVESEIELPSDILNCVEKLGDLSEHMSFTTANVSASSTSTSGCEDPTGEMIVSDAVVEIEEVIGDKRNSNSSSSNEENSRPTQLTYLDLDSRSFKDFYDSENSSNNNNNNNNENSGDAENIPLGKPLGSSTPISSKRRRGWSLEEEDSDEDEGNLSGSESIDRISPPNHRKFPHELNEKTKRKGLSAINVAKRLRFSPELEDSGMQMQSLSEESNLEEHESSSRSSIVLPVIIDTEFRTKKSHFDEDEQEDSDDDPFLGNALGQSPLDGDNEQLQNHSYRRSDQRVPSASSSSSSSDEDGDAENSMEVDQITNLVQFISFNKNQSHSSLSQEHVTASSPTSFTSNITGSSSPITTTSANSVCGSSTGLVRSMSSPDLCGLTASSARVSVSSSSANNAKDLFSSYVSNSKNSHIRHRVLTMTV